MQKIEKLTTYLFLALLPTQLAFHFWPAWAFVYGMRVDLLAPAIYLTDLLVLILAILNLGIFREFKLYFLLILAFAAVNIYFSVSPPESFYRWIKICEIFFVGFYFYKIKKIDIHVFFYSSIFFSLIGIAQFLISKTTGLFNFLGERTFNMAIPGIALVSLNGVEHLRAYSTFSHPNSLAGFLGAVLLFILLSGRPKKNYLNIFGILIILVCLFLTFSISSYIGMFVAFAFYLFSKNKKVYKMSILMFTTLSLFVSLMLPIISRGLVSSFPFLGENTIQRLDLAFIAGKMISGRFWIGEGLGTFSSFTWLLQPVHNIFLLFFSEVGIFGLLIFTYFTYKVLVKNPILFVFILFTTLTDHYWLTLQQNLLLLSILVGLSFRISPWKNK